MTTISNTDDIIDLRDVIERFEELEGELQEAHEAGQFMSDFDDWVTNTTDDSGPVYAAFGDERGHEVTEQCEEFRKLRELLRDCAGCGGDEQWRGTWYPLTLVRDTYFQDYAQELAEDIGAINADATWPNNCIDWEAAAAQLRMDYTSVEFDGVTYWTR